MSMLALAGVVGIIGYCTRREQTIVPEESSMNLIYSVWYNLGSDFYSTSYGGGDGNVWGVKKDMYPYVYDIPNKVWNLVSNQMAVVKIAAITKDKAYVLDPLGKVYKYENGAYTLLANGECAKDIATNTKGTLWLISCTARGTDGQHGIKQYQPSTNTFYEPSQYSFAMKIAVDSDDLPFVVTKTGQVLKCRSPNDWYEPMPGYLATEIAVGTGTLWFLNAKEGGQYGF